MLIEEGADIDAQGGRYGNALQAASEEGHLKIAELLIEIGASMTLSYELGEQMLRLMIA